MTIKIECESGYEMTQFLQPMVDAASECAQVREKMYQAQDKVRDLETQLRLAKEAKLAEPIPTHEAAVKNLLIAAYKGEKIAAIKCAREILGLGLKEAKDLVEAAQESSRMAPKPYY